jgi:hypothetical protein
MEFSLVYTYISALQEAVGNRSEFHRYKSSFGEMKNHVRREAKEITKENV